MNEEVKAAVKELVAITLRLGRDPIPEINELSQDQLTEAAISVVADKINGRYPGVPAEELEAAIKSEIEAYFKDLEKAEPKKTDTELPVPEGVTAALELYADALDSKIAVRIFQNTGRSRREILLSSAAALTRYALSQPDN
jgi:hypothetical protein